MSLDAGEIRIWAEDGDGEKRGHSKKKGQHEVKGPGSEKQEGRGALRAQDSRVGIRGVGKGMLKRTKGGPLPLPPTYKLCILDSGGGGWSSLSLESRSHEPSSSSLRQRRAERGEGHLSRPGGTMGMQLWLAFCVDPRSKQGKTK